MSRDETGVTTIEVPATIDERALPSLPARTTPMVTDALLAGRYRIGRRIGKGGMGEIMGARDEQVGRDVAIKRMKAANPSPRAIARFLREASIQGRLEHPAIAPVHEIGRDVDDLPFFAMKKLTGVTLAKLLEDAVKDPRGQPLPRTRVLRAFADVCLAVELAHVRGIVHRDLKPENIMLGDFGEVYVLDWGVAKVIGELEETDFADVDSSSGEHATVAGTAIGTPGYMAPEQARGASDVDGKADVYTLGCLLFEILTGEGLHPRGYDGLQSAIAGLDARPAVRTPTRDVPPELDALCVVATAIDRRNRPTARELGDRVQRFLDGDRDVALRRTLARDHLERGRTAFERGASRPEPVPAARTSRPPSAFGPTPEEARRVAMREAAAALALDPTLDGAAELVGRLMLEPPRQTPKEVEQLIRADDVRMATVNAWAGMWSLVGALLFLPLVYWISPARPSYVLALAAVMAVNLGICAHSYFTRTPRPGLLVIGNVFLVFATALLFSPVIVAPAIGAVLGLAMALTPRFSALGNGAVIGALMAASTLVPLLLEQLGVLAPSVQIRDGGMFLAAPGFSGAETPILVCGGLYIVALVCGATAMGHAMRSRTRDAYRHLHLQTWQLRQLVPAPPER